MNEKLISEALNHMTDAELIRTWNVIHDDESEFHIFAMEEINEMLENECPLDVLRAVPSDFDPFDDWIYTDCNGDIQSFSVLSDCPVYDENKIIDYVNDYGLDNFIDLKAKVKERQKDAQARLDELEKQIAELREVLK